MQECAVNIDMMCSSNLTFHEGKHEAIHVVAAFRDVAQRFVSTYTRKYTSQSTNTVINYQRISRTIQRTRERGIGFARDQTR